MKEKKFGYYVNEAKSWLIIKNSNHLDHAQNILKETGIKFTCEGKRYLGVVIGSGDFKSEYFCEKITNWTQGIIKLTEYSKTQADAAYVIFCRGVLHKYTYLMRMIQDIDEHLKPLVNIISNTFLPTLLDSLVSDNERSLF